MSHNDSGEPWLGPSGGNSHIHPDLNPTSFASFDPVSNNLSNTNPTAQRSTSVPYDSLYDPPVQQQQTHPPNPTYPPYQQISEARYHSDSYNGASPVSGSPDPQHLPPLDVSEDGRWQGQSYYTSYSHLQIPLSNESRSPHSVYSPASSSVQYQSPAGSHPAEHSPSRGAVHTGTAASTLGMSHVSLERIASSSRGPMQLPYARVLTAPSPVPFNVPHETSDPAVKKKRKRADARQLEALNGMYARTAFPSTEERQQLARDLEMSPQSVQIWFKNKRQASRQGGRNPPNPPISRGTVAPPSPVSRGQRMFGGPPGSILAFLAFLVVLAAAFVIART